MSIQQEGADWGVQWRSSRVLHADNLREAREYVPRILRDDCILYSLNMFMYVKFITLQ
jgi:hypothetical protein